MIEHPQRLTSVVREQTDGSLRSITEYHKRDYTIHYFRDDIDANYSDNDVTDIIDELVMGSLGATHFESLFNAGDFECSIFGFEQAVMFHFLRNDVQGVFITVDRDVHLNLDEFIRACKQELSLEA